MKNANKAVAELSTYFESWTKLSIKANMSGSIALEAVKRDGYALMYVKEQTEAIALEAVKRNGYALRYVKEQTFGVNK